MGQQVSHAVACCKYQPGGEQEFEYGVSYRSSDSDGGQGALVCLPPIFSNGGRREDHFEPGAVTLGTEGDSGGSAAATVAAERIDSNAATFGQPTHRDGLMFSECITGFFSLVWPKLSVAASRIMEKQFLTEMQSAVQRVPALQGIIHHRLRFGDSPPEILVVHSYRRNASADSPDMDLEICGLMRWETNLEMEMNFGPVNMGINRLSMEGIGCLVLKPLLDHEPVMGGFQVYFCNPPRMHVGITGLGGVTNWSLVDAAIQRLFQETFKNMMVLPNRFIIRFANTQVSDRPAFRNPPPLGALRVRVLGASDLAGVDTNLMGGRTSDPYCVLRLGSHEFRTRTIKRTCDPEWGEQEFFDFLLYHERQSLHVEIFDYAMVQKDVMLGCLHHKYSALDLLGFQLTVGARNDVNLPLDTPDVTPAKRSTVRLQIEYFDFPDAGEQPARPRPQDVDVALLSVKVYHFRGSPGKLLEGGQVRLTVGDQVVASKKAKAIKPTDHYGFGQQKHQSICVLSKGGTPVDVISQALDISVDAVKDVLLWEEGTKSRFGLDQTLHVCVRMPANAVAKLELVAQDQCFPIGSEFHLAELLEKGPCCCEKEALPVHLHGIKCEEQDLRLEVACQLRPGDPLQPRAALWQLGSQTPESVPPLPSEGAPDQSASGAMAAAQLHRERELHGGQPSGLSRRLPSWPLDHEAGGSGLAESWPVWWGDQVDEWHL